MAKGKSNNNSNDKKALKLQQQQLKESREQSKRLERMMRSSAHFASSQVLPKFEGAAAAPTQTTADLEAVAMDARQRTMRRQGLNSTVYAGAR